MNPQKMSPDILMLDPTKLLVAKTNPNSMEPERFEMLKQAISRMGFLQPVLVRELGKGQHEIVDGHHRADAAKQLGLPTIPCVVTTFDDSRAAMASLGMNRLRGDLNLSQVADILVTLKAEGWTTEDLQLTGFSPDEVNDLLESTKTVTAEQVMQGGAANVGGDGKEGEPAGFSLELKFNTAKQLREVKRILRKAGEGDPARGLLKLVAVEEE